MIRTIHINVHAPLLPRLPAIDAQEDCAVRVLGVTLCKFVSNENHYGNRRTIEVSDPLASE